MKDKTLDRVKEIKNDLKNNLTLVEVTKEKFFGSEFYRDIDKLKNKSSCSVPLIFFILLLIFSGIVYSLVLVRNYTHSGINFIVSNRENSQADLRDTFYKKTQNILPGETQIVNFSEQEISNYLGVSDPDFPLKKSTLHINQSGIIITGRTSDNIISLPVQILITPKIDQNKLTFILDNIQTGSIKLPSSIKDQLNVYLDNVIRSKNLYDKNLEVVSVSTLDGILRLEIHKIS